MTIFDAMVLKDSLDTFVFRTFRTLRGGGMGFLNKSVDFGGPKLHMDS